MNYLERLLIIMALAAFVQGINLCIAMGSINWNALVR